MELAMRYVAANIGYWLAERSLHSRLVCDQQHGRHSRLFGCVCGPSLIPWNKWTALSLVFSSTKGLFGKSTLTVYVNNDKDLLLFHYGGCPQWVEETCYSSLALKLSARCLGAKAPPVKQPTIWSSLGLGSGSSQTKRLTNFTNIGIGEERPLWGPLNSFRGRLSYAVIFNESASEAFIQWLVQGGMWSISNSMEQVDGSLFGFLKHQGPLRQINSHGLREQRQARCLGAKAPPVKQPTIWSSLGLGSGSSQTKRLTNFTNIGIGEERPLWGPLNSFRGRLSYAVIFNESASEAFIQWLVQGGENTCTLVTDLILQNPQRRVLFYYHAKAVNNASTMCFDLSLSGAGQPKESSESESNSVPYCSPAYLHGAVRITSTTLVDSLYRLGGIQFLLPLFELIGNCPIEPDVNVQTNSNVLEDLLGALRGFQQLLRTTDSPADISNGVRNSPDFGVSPSFSQHADETPQYTLLDGTNEVLQLASHFLTSPTNFTSFNLSETGRSSSQASHMFNFLKTVFKADTRVRQSFLQPTVILALGHLLNSIDPMQLNSNAVLSFHNMLDMCASSVLNDLGTRVEASGDSSSLIAEERRVAKETFRVRWHFLIKQLFIDWGLWSRCSPVATLQHIGRLQKKAKALGHIYRGHLPIDKLLTAVGFFFAPRKNMNDALKPVIPLLPEDSRHTMEVSLLEASNILLKYIRHGIYSIIRTLYAKNATESDLKLLFAFLESAAHPTVISEVIVLIAHIFDSISPGDSLVNLAYEQRMLEKVYYVLLAPSERMHIKAKENALKLLCKLAATERVPERIKTNIFFTNSGGFRGFLAQTASIRELAYCSETCRLLYDLIGRTFRKDYAGLLQYLSVLRMCRIRSRISAISLLLDVLEDDKSTALRDIQAIPAFYESLIDLIIKSKKTDTRVSTSPWSNEVDIYEDETDNISDLHSPPSVGRQRQGYSSQPLILRRKRSTLSTSSPIASPSAEMPMSANVETRGPRKRLSFGSISSTSGSKSENQQNVPVTLNESEEESESEELGETLGNLVVKVFNRLLWPGSSLILSMEPTTNQIEEALSRYYQVLVSLSDSSATFTFIKPYFWFLQRILEEFLKSTSSCLRSETPSLRSYPAIAPFISMIIDETCNRGVSNDFDFRPELLDHLNELVVERLRVWEEVNSRPEEFVAMILHFYLTWASRGTFPDNGAAAQACALLHDAICVFNPDISFERIIFLLYRINDMIQRSFNGNYSASDDKNLIPFASGVDLMFQPDHENDDNMWNSEAYFFYSPLVKALFDKYKDKMNVDDLAPHLPHQSSNFITEFRVYLSKYPEEWRESFLGTYRKEVETYTRSYIVSPSTEQSLIRALANETLIKARKERFHQTTQATQRLSELYPNLVIADHTSTDNPPSFQNRNDLRRGSIGSRSLKFAFSGFDSAVQQPIQVCRSRLPGGEIFDFQLLEREMKVLSRIRKNRWLNIRFEFVRGFPTSLWYSPFPQEIRWRLSQLETTLRIRNMLEPNPWFSKHSSASEERDGLICQLSNLEDGEQLIQNLTMAEEAERKLSIFLQNADTLFRGSKRPLAKYSLDETNYGKLPLLRRFSTESIELQSTLALHQLDSIRLRLHKASVVDRKDVRGDFVADEDWKLIRFDGSDKSDEVKSSSSVDYPKSSNDNDHSEQDTEEVFSPSGISTEPSEKSLLVDTGEKGAGESRDKGGEEVQDDDEAVIPHTLSFEKPAPLVGEVMRASCQLISLVRSVPGWFAVTPTSLHFLQNHCEPVSSDVAGSDKFREIEATKDFSIVLNLNEIREVHLCRYNLRRSGLEIFLIDHRNFLFNFPGKLRNKVYTCIMSHRMPQLIYRKGRSPAEVFKYSKLMERWANREISNFEYLMRLNTIAGRTYNDLSQYPVMPWILADYTSKQLNFDEPSTFRDLSRPIGIVNPDNVVHVREKYESFEDPAGEISKFHYGTHYSSAAGVMHYLVRTEPFTSLHIQLQGQRFDVADRQFNSIPTAWSLIMSSPYDNRELIPEFFYFPDFLRNENHFDLGRPQLGGNQVDDVELPPWASTPEEFIRIHRGALESDYVSANIHNWIDLIFGYKQKGRAAEAALNVYYYLTYEGAVDLDDVTDPMERASIEGMIKNFGQTPCQLLNTPHMTRISYSDWVYETMIQRQLPLLNAAIIYMKTNIESNSRNGSPDRDNEDTGPTRKLSVRLSRRRTRSTFTGDDYLPIELNQHTIEVYFSYHPAPRSKHYTHPPAFCAVSPHHFVQLRDLNIEIPTERSPGTGNVNQKRGSLHDGILLDKSTRARFVSNLKSIMPAASTAATIGVSAGSINSNNSNNNNTVTTSNHLTHQVVTVDTAGWVRQHHLIPLAQNEPGALSETELLMQMRGFKKSPFRAEEDGGFAIPEASVSSLEPEPISPAHLEQERLTYTPTSARQRSLGPLLYPPREFVTKVSKLKPTSLFAQVYAVSTNGCHLYSAGRWDNRIAVYNTQTSRLDTLVTTPHTDIITAIAVDPGCYRKSAQHGSASQYLITGSRDGTVCVWNFTLFSGRMTKQVRADRTFIEVFEATKKLETESSKCALINNGSGNSSIKANQNDGYPTDMQEEIAACLQPGMPFDDSTLNFGCGCKVADAHASGGRKTAMSNSNFMSVPPTEVAKVIRFFPADESGRPITNVALYLALDMAICASKGSNILKMYAVKRGVWTRQVALPDTANIEHLLIHSISSSFLVQWTIKGSRGRQLRLSRFNMNGRCVAESPVFQENKIPPPSPPANTQVTQMLTETLSPSANSRTVVNHMLLLSTTSGHLIMREVESLTQLRIFSIGAPIVHMSMTLGVYGGGVNLILSLANGAFVIAYPGLTAPLNTLTSISHTSAGHSNITATTSESGSRKGSN
nr:beige:beach protein [Hymenolepis microstoma]